jgi:hypothetical protein
MGRVSNLQKQAGQEFLQNQLGLPIQNPCLAISDQSAGTTKETQDKRVSLPNAPTREGSPFREAIPSRSGQNKIEMVREVFGRKTLYSIDVHGRRSRIETEHLSNEGYHKLLEAMRNPFTVQGTMQMTNDAQERPQEIPEGCKRGEETGLLIPAWWKTNMGETAEEKWATIQDNLTMAREKLSNKRTNQHAR